MLIFTNVAQARAIAESLPGMRAALGLDAHYIPEGGAYRRMLAPTDDAAILAYRVRRRKVLAMRDAVSDNLWSGMPCVDCGKVACVSC